jgi:hypothetical protein
VRVRFAYRPHEIWRQIGQPAEARAARSIFDGLKADRRLAQVGHVRGKKTEFGVLKKWLDIVSILEHDFTHE